MLRGFRHTLFLLLQIGVAVSGAAALALWPQSWPAILVCVCGSLLASILCERAARGYLRSTLGRLRRVADDLGHGRITSPPIEARPGEDFYKLVSAIHLVAERLAEARHGEERLQEELRRRERLAFLGELAASVAHEVNNPLDGVQNCARILRRSLEDRERAGQMLDLIDGGLERLELLVRRLLTLARENVIRAERLPLAQVLRSAVEQVRPRLEACGIRLAMQMPEQEFEAAVDAALIEQVFANLMLNAADSMSGGGELSITLRRERGKRPSEDGDVLCVDVADTGSGIPPEVLPHIFEPFYTTKAGGKGTGLGLAISARIVDAHQGSIRVAPRTGGGTVFTVVLPALPEPAGPAAPALRPAVELHGT